MRDGERMHYALLGDPVHQLVARFTTRGFATWDRASYLCLSFQGTGEALAQTLLAGKPEPLRHR